MEHKSSLLKSSYKRKVKMDTCNEMDRTFASIEPLNLFLIAAGEDLANNNDAAEATGGILEGYHQIKQMRARATVFRQGYANWRRQKPHGARGDFCDVFLENEKQKAKKNNFQVEKPINFDEILQNIKKCREEQKDKPADPSQNILLKAPSAEATVLTDVKAEDSKSLPRQENAAPVVIRGGSDELKTHERERAKSVKDDILLAKQKLSKEQGRLRTGSACAAEWLRFYYNPWTPFDSFTYNKLNQRSLLKFKDKMSIPVYTRDAKKVDNWILHVGVGGFHRSHQAVFLDDLLTNMHLEKYGGEVGGGGKGGVGGNKANKPQNVPGAPNGGSATAAEGQNKLNAAIKPKLKSSISELSDAPAGQIPPHSHPHSLPHPPVPPHNAYHNTAVSPSPYSHTHNPHQPSHPPYIRHTHSFHLASSSPGMSCDVSPAISQSSSFLGLPKRIAEGTWALCGIGLMEFDKKMYEVLKEQDMLYTVLTRSSVSSNARVIGSIMDYIYAPEQGEKLIARLKDEKTKIVSLTVTEKGYCQDTHGNLDRKNPHIAHDLEHLQRPRTVIGLLVLGLMLRRKERIPPFSVLSCDNLPDNGNVIKKMVLQFAEMVDPELSIWIQQSVAFPNTMVDRITPITGNEHKELLKKDFGVDDAWPVVAEEFRQWVIEDKFCNVRPGWESVGALLVDDVRSYEVMKLRLLNGGHTAIAYLSYLAGYRFVDDAVTDVLISSYLRAYMDEVSSTVRGVSIELERYKEQIVERFGNKFIKDNLMRIAEDGSTKFYNTMKDCIKELHAERRHIHHIAFGFACWIRYMTGIDESGESIVLKDDRAEILKKYAQKAYENCTNYEHIEEYVKQVFGEDIFPNDVLINELRVCLSVIKKQGVKSIIRAGDPLHALLLDTISDTKGTDRLLKFAGITE